MNNEQIVIENHSHGRVADDYLERMTRGQLRKLIRELEAQVAFLKHTKITCCVCDKPFDIQYTCPACAMGRLAHKGHEEHEGENDAT